MDDEKVVAHTARVEAEIACGRAACRHHGTRSAHRQHPYREPLWAQLITAYYLPTANQMLSTPTPAENEARRRPGHRPGPETT